jgi:hypothetical protein
VTIEEAALAASCFAALVGNSYLEAAQALREMTKKATRRRGERGVALSSGRGGMRLLRLAT